ncbi:hypothetical protein [Sphingomonas sp. RB1R13]|uniref:hypothetical protein n=1 Tax=Sphingomonas sp. RB1R13 TaxID=3096159 RepID=UPI002FCAC3C1
MSDLAITPRDHDAASPFTQRSMLIILVVGLISFAAMLVLGAYAPDLRSGRNGGAHALSNAATGYSGLVALAEATDRNPLIIRNERQLDSEDLAVLAPEKAAVNLNKALTARATRPTLIILPKWQTSPDPDHRGWVTAKGLLPPAEPQGILAPNWPMKVDRQRASGPLTTLAPAATGVQFAAPVILQTVSAPQMIPLITDAQGHIVLGRLNATVPLFILADPDLLSNRAMADPNQAKAALALLDYLNSTDADAILFDVTLNGFGHSPSPLRLAFDPPFLATTLAMLAALILVSVQALNRFGPVRRRTRALAFGKAALIDNAAALARKAGREAAFGPRYAAMLRDRAIATFRVPPRLRDGAIDTYLDRIDPKNPFSTLAATTGEPHRPEALLAAARALHSWPRETGA